MNPKNTVMQKILYHKITRLFFIMFLLGTFSGCGEMFENPLVDKETGEDIHLFIIDQNIFHTKMTFNLLDDSDSSTISAPATITFSGKNGNDIVTFSGEKRSEFVISQGQMELTIDPNITISEDTPFEFSVNVEAAGYNSFLKEIQFQTEGVKTINLNLTKVTL